jgi:hypothetical protein
MGTVVSFSWELGTRHAKEKRKLLSKKIPIIDMGLWVTVFFLP